MGFVRFPGGVGGAGLLTRVEGIWMYDRPFCVNSPVRCTELPGENMPLRGSTLPDEFSFLRRNGCLRRPTLVACCSTSNNYIIAVRLTASPEVGVQTIAQVEGL